jgi:hypothetical protein
MTEELKDKTAPESTGMAVDQRAALVSSFEITRAALLAAIRMFMSLKVSVDRGMGLCGEAESTSKIFEGEFDLGPLDAAFDRIATRLKEKEGGEP